MLKRNKIKLVAVMLMLGALFLAGCSEWLEENSELWEEAELQAAADNDEENGLSSVETDCYVDEIYLSEESRCITEWTCDDLESCENLGNELMSNLIENYGSFVNLEESEIEENEKLSALEEQPKASYWVEEEELVLEDGDESDDHRELWEGFAAIIPPHEREDVTLFTVFSHYDTLGFVRQNDDDYSTWTFGLNIEGAASLNEAVNTNIHEFGHLLTLRTQQVDPDAEEHLCNTYYVDDGCAESDAYIYAFYQQFWSDDQQDEDEDSFVSEYALTNILEDIAESWAFFVLADRPDGDTVVEQKILFFYEYEELVKLRTELLARITSWRERAAS
ncbi:hypothetical protein EBB07_04955 [Paenibacillaceae bacterium]|nr:hypothetical protein EBB07_04955 [Paenibacillaceae bacterium]